MRTEFGRGYVTCLFLFLGHTRRLHADAVIYRDMETRHPGLFGEAHAVEMWANGASDHLFDLVMPRRKIRAQSKRIAKGLAERALATGRPYFGKPLAIRNVTEARRSLIKPAQRLVAEAASETGHRYPRSIEEAVAIDADLGLKADPRGYRSCFRADRRAAA